MRHFKINLICSILISMVGMSAWAHDIAVMNTEGITIYYNWTNNKKELAVTHEGDYYNTQMRYTDEVIFIPEKVTYNGRQYSVTAIDEGAFWMCSTIASVTLAAWKYKKHC